MTADENVRLRISAGQKALWESHAQEMGVSLSQLVKLAVQAAILAGPRRVGDTFTEVIAVRRELNAAGNNLNQVARKLNAHGSVDAEECSKILNDVRVAAAAASAVLRVR